MIGIRETALSLALVLVFTATVSTTPAPAWAEEYVPPKTMWVAKRANVRAGPSTKFVKTDLLEVGERVTVVAKTGDWFQLSRRAGQPKRFVYAPLLTKLNPIAAHRTVSQSAVKTINFGNGDRYHGEIRNGQPHGRGVYTWAGGDQYEGDFVNNKRTGRGVYTWAEGGRYEGDFVNGKRTGRGVYTWADGGRYQGDFINGKRTGRGVETWPDGRRYEGDFIDGEKHGRGIYTSTDGYRYEGEFVNDLMHGHGEFWWPDGKYYEGEWRNNREQGHGTLTWPDGERYEGEFFDGEITGRGVYSSVDVGRQESSERGDRADSSSLSAGSGSLWGAIAVGELRYKDERDVHSNPAAIVLNRASRKEAERDSVENCHKLYPRELFDPPYDDCDVYVTFSTSSSKPDHSAEDDFYDSGFQTERPHRCGAYVEGAFRYRGTTRVHAAVAIGVGSGNSKLQAERDAKVHCDLLNGHSSCQVELSSCNRE